MNKDQIREAVKTYRTPSYVFDIDRLKERVQRIQRNLGERVQVCYAMKANPFLITPLESIVHKYEVCSPGEFHICERAGISMEKIVLSGVYKAPEDIRHAMAHYGAKGTYTIESEAHLALLEACAGEANIRIRALIRITSGNQFGVDEETAARMIQRREQYPHVQIAGVQQYSGTQKKKMKKMAEELQRLDAFIARMEAEWGYKAEELEYGPGFYVPYFQNDPEVDDDALLEEFRGLLEGLQFQGKITLEMGRYLAADCGYYLTRIVDQKVNMGQRYGIVDGGIHHLNYYGQTMAMKLPHYQQVKPEMEGEGEEELWTICGALCTVNDVIVKQLPLRNPKIGDVLVFERVGAYSVTEGIYLFLSRELPEILFLEKGQLRSVRRRRGTDAINCME